MALTAAGFAGRSPQGGLCRFAHANPVCLRGPARLARLIIGFRAHGNSLYNARWQLGSRWSMVHKGIWVALIIVVAVLVYVLAKVIYYARLSRQQWQDVDRSKLREWKDDDDW
ncbi:MAG: hypothetical protein WBN23_08510 [Woeseia sp.]